MALADYINNKPVIETNRLILRPMIVSDISALKKWMPDKLIYTYWGKGQVRLGCWAAVALTLMMIGAIGTGIAPPQYFGIVERCSVFAATGYNAVLGWYLFKGFGQSNGCIYD